MGYKRHSKAPSAHRITGYVALLGDDDSRYGVGATHKGLVPSPKSRISEITAQEQLQEPDIAGRLIR